MTSLRVILFLLLQILNVYSFDFGINLENSFFEIEIDRDHPDKLYKDFEDFIVKYKRTYKDEIEKKFRFQQFVQTHNSVQEMNKKSAELGHSTKFGHNQFSDRSKEEITSLYTKVAPEKNPNLPVLTKNNFRVKRQLDNLPKNFDLRDKKIGGRVVISDIKNQGTCASCWVFAATGLAEVALSVYHKKTIVSFDLINTLTYIFQTLSDQEVCDCATKPETTACMGGQPEDGLEYIKQMGLSVAEKYEYNVTRANLTGQCANEKHARELKPNTLGYYKLDEFNAAYLMTRHLYNYNIPVAVAFRTSYTFNYYEGGVLELPLCDDEEKEHWHSGIIIGYGTEKNETTGKKANFWIFKNSWDKDWGEEGYGKIVRGEDWCNIESHVKGARIDEHIIPSN
uniref:Pept_C1 domain-containing protein n=1 Tax=Caenorhabditis tropicalis TaxID=1561998 RepID=A0A1I7U7U3_9PELO